MPAHVGTGIFDVADGDFCFAAGSSGWDLPGKKSRRRFAEVVKRGGSAARAVGDPIGGKNLLWRLLSR